MSLLAAFKRLPAVQRGRIILGVQLTVAALALFSAPIVSWLMEADRVGVFASNYYSDDHAARFATDGIPATEWLLPDGVLGYIELSFGGKRTIHGVTVTNGHNLNYMDRAIRKARISVFDGDRVVEKHDIELPGIEPEHKQRRIQLKGHRASRVRLEVLEFDGTGAALAEIAVD
jgi:hypothetical protein